MNKNKVKLILDIFLTFFKLGSVSFGGGYSMIPLIEREVVEEKKWVDKEKIVDILAVSQSLPGAVALNVSAFVGYAVGGVPGALIAWIGNAAPSVIIILTLSVLFSKISSYPVVVAAFKGIYPAIVGMIAYAAYKIGKTSITGVVSVIITLASFAAIMFLKADPIAVIISAAAAGLFIHIAGVWRSVGKRSKEEVKK